MLDKKIKLITLTSLFIALVVIGSRIYVGTHDTFRFHLGNSMCLLAAFVLPPLYGGIAAGVGSMLFDILFYTSGPACIITLVTKFVMAMQFEAVVPIVLTKVGASVFNAIAAVIISSIIYKLIKNVKI